MKKFLLLFGIVLVIYSSFHIYNWLIDSNNTKHMIQNITENVILKEEDSRIHIDFSKLKAINSDTIGWIEVDGTEVSYPFTQTNNNDFYLTHSFDKSYNSAGWIFLDYRNDISHLQKNTILYAHGRLDNTMFGSLNSVLDTHWYENSSHIIKISTPEQTSIWEIFSVYHIPATDDYIKIDFDSEQEFLNFIAILKNRSIYDFNTEVSDSNDIITLSTCYRNNSKERLVIHAKLTK